MSHAGHTMSTVIDLPSTFGQIDIYLFGNPRTGNSSLLGWYAAYVKSE